MSRRSLNILVSGMIAADPWQGGATWAVLQYVLGFRRLGHHVWFVEPVPSEQIAPGARLSDSRNVPYFRSIVAQFGLEDHAALLLDGSRETAGMSYESICEIAGRCDLLINISGMLTDPAITGPIPCRVYLDLDPAFNQLWHAVQGIDMRFDGHTHFVTVGSEIGKPGCTVPTCGRTWIPTLQPVVLQQWSVASIRPEHDALTTIANWRGYGSIEHDGIFYGQKAHSFRKFLDLPMRTNRRFMPAIAIHPDETKDLAALTSNNWHLVDPADVAGTPDAYRDFVRGSWGEIGIAKSGYVASRCGWFSDRSVCYLASGRPVLAQDTGFSQSLPIGRGLIGFNTTEEALAGIEAFESDYPAHARAARDIAEEFFDSNKVLSRLLSILGVA